ncbi:MAG TPA: CBS domain-containing protein [Herpetosiphonaceae bacterium]
MRTIFVRDVMSSPVITASLSTSLPQLNSLMREHHIRRLPVVDGNRLVGMITFGDIRSALPSDATTLSVYELSYLIEQVTAAEVMRDGVITISADASVAEAAQQMLEHKISGLPVVERDHLVGIITESDIFRAISTGLIPVANKPDLVAATSSRQERTRV